MSWQPPPWTWSAPSHCGGTFEWFRSSHGDVPPRSVHGGVDVNGMPIFVGRAWHHGDLLPAKVTPAHRCAFVTYGGRQKEEHHYEVLVSDHVAWRPCRGGGSIPPEAIRVGHTRDGEPLYMGRTMHHGTLTPGKVHPSHGCLYIAWDGYEIKYYDYEIMVLD
uniref:Natterin-3 n=1 Tax=Lygus hesperus TaxID=30085 RepID=A0A0A9YG15_LYGHE